MYTNWKNINKQQQTPESFFRNILKALMPKIPKWLKWYAFKSYILHHFLLSVSDYFRALGIDIIWGIWKCLYKRYCRVNCSQRNMSLFHLISWCRNFVERHIFRIASGDSYKTMPKISLSTKFPHQEIRWNYGILRSGWVLESVLLSDCFASIKYRTYPGSSKNRELIMWVEACRGGWYISK